ncbi:unnamed protein product [Rodentolepis nana]|uniref:Ig-like domain-containing protein n=1 Tax=Rodentolepis nana TaxID=102285 RepID=A0A0R3TQK5_RODNA|nr:unnamed protein product [Rodentolepis nana]
MTAKDRPVVLSHFAKSVFLTSGQPGHIVCCLSGFPEVSEVMWHQRVLANAVKAPEPDENSTIHTNLISGQPFPSQFGSGPDQHIRDFQQLLMVRGWVKKPSDTDAITSSGATTYKFSHFQQQQQQQDARVAIEVAIVNEKILASASSQWGTPDTDVMCYKKLISFVIPELAGAYTCQGKNDLGWGQRSTPFDVFVQGE